jgi:hypothetical protein
MPATPRDWSDPFLEQAREDLRAAYAVPAADSASTLCMLLQMVFEKLAKAAFSRAGAVNANSHQVATRLFLLLDRNPVGKTLLQATPNVRQFVAELENAHPAVANKSAPPWPRLEYPWEDASGKVLYPAKDLALARRVRNPNDRILVHCLKFASALEEQLTTIIP